MALNLGIGGTPAFQPNSVRGVPGGSGEVSDQMRSDWNDFFSQTPEGQSVNWGGGTLTNAGGGNAKFASSDYNTTFNQGDIAFPSRLQTMMAYSPGVANEWAKYGIQPDSKQVEFADAGRRQTFNSANGTNGGGNTGAAPGGIGQNSGRNPYLQQMGDAIQAQSNQNLQQNILPGIGQGAQAAGMYGSSRQGTAEGIAMGNAQTGVNSALANMYLQGYGQDQSYNLGLGNLALGNKNSDQGFYSTQRGQDLQQVGLGAGLFQQANQGMLNQGQGIYNLGLTGQQAPWQAAQNFNGVAQPYTGFGSTTGNQEGSKGAGFLGGALAGSQAYNIFSK